LNPQPADYKSAALPIELRQLTGTKSIYAAMSKIKSFQRPFFPEAEKRRLALEDGPV
jgi:hypothetical protein